MKFTVTVKQQYLTQTDVLEALKKMSDAVVKQDDYVVFVSNRGYDELTTYLRNLRIVHKLETRHKLTT